MPIFTPGRRWQPLYLPFKKKPLCGMLAAVERMVKGPLFGCRMCGNCMLQETAFICSMECPKGIRNGPCGGSTQEHCYVDETRPCIWYQIYDRAFKMGREEKLLEVLPPLDWDKVGKRPWETWLLRYARLEQKLLYRAAPKIRKRTTPGIRSFSRYASQSGGTGMPHITHPLTPSRLPSWNAG